MGRAEKRNRPRRFGGETADRLQASDPRSHRVNDTPAARQSAETDGGVGE